MKGRPGSIPARAAIALAALGAIAAALLGTMSSPAAATQGPRVDSTDLPQPASPPEATPRTGGTASSAVSSLSFAERIAEAEAAYARGDYEAALQAYAAASAVAPSTPEKVSTLVTRATLEHAQGLLEAARQHLFEAVYLDPTLVLSPELHAQELIDLFYSAQQEAIAARQREAARLVRAGREAADRGDLDGARTFLEGALTLLPNDPSALLQLASVDLKEGRTEAALAAYERVVSLRKARVENVSDELAANALSNLGQLYIERGFAEDGAARLKEALAIDPTIAEAWIQLALAERALGRRDDSRESLLKARALRPGDEAVLHNLGLHYVEARRWPEALALLRDATERNPQSARLWNLQAIATRASGDPAAAEIAFRRVLEVDAQNTLGLAQRAAVELSQLAYDRGDDVVAEREARRALIWSADDPAALDALGLTLLRRGELDNALVAFEHSTRVDPTRADSFNFLGSVLYRLSRWVEAEAAFERALSLRPGLVDAADNLALTRRRRAELALIREQLGFAAEGFAKPGAMSGIRVSEVDPEGSGAKAGLENGDLVTRIEKAPVATPSDLHAYLILSPLPKAVQLEVLRGGRLTKMKLRLR